jgi:hypothetical protein
MTKNKIKAALRDIKKQLEDIRKLENIFILDSSNAEDFDFEDSVSDVFSYLDGVIAEIKMALKE